MTHRIGDRVNAMEVQGRGEVGSGSKPAMTFMQVRDAMAARGYPMSYAYVHMLHDKAIAKIAKKLRALGC